MRPAGNLSDQVLYKMDAIKFQEVRDQFFNPVQIIYCSCSRPPCRVLWGGVLMSCWDPSAALSCSCLLIYQGEPMLIKCHWARRCVIHHRKHKHKPGKENFHLFWRTVSFLILFFFARFLFPAKQKFHISGRAGIYIKFTEAFASVSAVFRDQRDGVNLMRCSGDGGNMNYSPLLRQADGGHLPRFSGCVVASSFFWCWKRLFYNKPLAPGFGTSMAQRHLLIRHGAQQPSCLCRFNRRQWTMVFPKLCWRQCEH